MRPSKPLMGVGGGGGLHPFCFGVRLFNRPSPLFFSYLGLVLLPSRLRTRMSRNLSPRSLLSERPLGIDYQSKLRHKHTHKHKHKKNELVRFSCDYAYVDPVFTCLHMCLCLCLCPSELENQAQEICCYLNRVQCLQLADNENRQYADTVPSVSKARLTIYESLRSMRVCKSRCPY